MNSRQHKSGAITARLAKWSTRLLQWLLILAGTAGVVAMLFFLSGFFHQKVPPGESAGERRLPAGARVVPVRLLRQPRFETAVGEIRPVHESSVASRVLARVAEVTVRAGQAVNEGDLLVRLDDADLQARKKQAESQRDAATALLQQAGSDFERATRLLASSAISRAEYDAANAGIRTAEAELQRAVQAVTEAGVQLEFTSIRAPFTGVVIEKQVEPGDTAVPGKALLTLYDPVHMQLVANVRESLALRLKVGQKLVSRLESMDYQCEATVSEVVPQADAASRSFAVKVTGPCPPGVYSGMFGRLYLPLDEEELLVVPAAAIQRVGQLTLVEVTDGSLVRRRYVRTGRELGEETEILSGLQAGEQVVVSGPAQEQAAGSGSSGGQQSANRMEGEGNR